MRFVAFRQRGRKGLAVALPDGSFAGLCEGQHGYPGQLDQLIAAGGAPWRRLRASTSQRSSTCRR